MVDEDEITSLGPCNGGVLSYMNKYEQTGWPTWTDSCSQRRKTIAVSLSKPVFFFMTEFMDQWMLSRASWYILVRLINVWDITCPQAMQLVYFPIG
jgi:hypothetical protein